MFHLDDIKDGMYSMPLSFERSFYFYGFSFEFLEPLDTLRGLPVAFDPDVDLNGRVAPNDLREDLICGTVETVSGHDEIMVNWSPLTTFMGNFAMMVQSGLIRPFLPKQTHLVPVGQYRLRFNSGAIQVHGISGFKLTSHMKD